MTTLTILDNEFATLWYHPIEKIVHHQVHKFIYGQFLIDLLMAGTETLRKNHGNKWLSDDRGNSVLRKEDVEWAQSTWFPQTVKAGWKYWAIVQPEKVLAQMTLENVVKQYAEGGIIAKFFSDPDEALVWLKSQK